MISSSSTISSSRRAEFAAARRLGLHLLLFLAPIALMASVGQFLGMRSGELMPVRDVAIAQARSEPFIYLAKLSDHNYRLKLEAARLKRPEILVLGSSRANQWRSAMFKPYDFYNAGNAQFRFSDFTRFLEELGPPYPRVVLFSLDFYQFNAAWGRLYESVAYDDIEFPESLVLAEKLLERYISSPGLILEDPVDPVYGVPAVGLSASELGIGFRLDGSYQYGWAFGGAKLGVDADQAIERLRNGEPPFLFAAELDRGETEEFERFTDLAAQKGIQLVGVTVPYDLALPPSIDASERHEIWKAFFDPAFQRWITSQGVQYFDFAHLATFGGKADEFIDAFHPSETAYVRMLLEMLETPSFRSLVPKLDEGILRLRLQDATNFEVFRNDF